MSIVDRLRSGNRKAKARHAFEQASNGPKDVNQAETPQKSTVGNGNLPPVSSRKYTEKDNQGNRLNRQAAVREYVNQTQQAFLRYSFDSREGAEAALRICQCIHTASDTGNLIAIKPYTFGCYRRDDGQFEVLLGGEALTNEAARVMKNHFDRLGGLKRGENRQAGVSGNTEGQRLKEVAFLKEYTEITDTGTFTCRMYHCEDPIAATVFLKRRQNFVNSRDLRIVVQTPKITYYRDFDGIHEEA